MEDFRSKSYRDGMDSYYRGGGGGGKAEPTSMQEWRSYSVNYAGYGKPAQLEKAMKIKKVKSNLESSSSKSWSFNDPELQRRRRVAGYKAYAVEGKMKGSLRKSFRWIKETYSQLVYGWK